MADERIPGLARAQVVAVYVLLLLVVLALAGNALDADREIDDTALGLILGTLISLLGLPWLGQRRSDG